MAGVLPIFSTSPPEASAPENSKDDQPIHSDEHLFQVTGEIVKKLYRARSSIPETESSLEHHQPAMVFGQAERTLDGNICIPGS